MANNPPVPIKTNTNVAGRRTTYIDGDVVISGSILQSGVPVAVTKEDLGLGNVDNTSDVDKPVSTAQQEAINNAIAIVSGNIPAISALVSGGIVIWESAYTFRVSAAVYFIQGVLYSAAEQTITLDAAHATLDRIDVLVLSTSGALVKITGTAAAQPSEPDFDPTTQLKLTFVLVTANTSAPVNVSNENIYLNNAEWTSSTSGSGWNANSTSNPHAGTKDIEGTNVASNAYVQLQRVTSISLDSYATLSMFIRSKATWNANRVLRLQWFLNGVAKGTALTVASGYWGFDSSQVSTYQLIAIPLSQFVLPAGQLVNQLRITDVGGAIGLYIDDIVLQVTATDLSVPPVGISQSQADARYLQKANNLSDLTSPGTARTNLGLPFELVVAVSDETTALTAGTGKVTFRMPRAITLTGIRATLTTAQASGNIFTVDVNEGGSSILSTKLTIDNGEKTSTTAATPAVISDPNLADDAEITIDIDQIGDGSAKGLKVVLIGTRI